MTESTHYDGPPLAAATGSEGRDLLAKELKKLKADLKEQIACDEKSLRSIQKRLAANETLLAEIEKNLDPQNDKDQATANPK